MSVKSTQSRVHLTRGRSSFLRKGGGHFLKIKGHIFSSESVELGILQTILINGHTLINEQINFLSKLKELNISIQSLIVLVWQVFV
jgi:hypothetical protein